MKDTSNNYYPYLVNELLRRQLNELWNKYKEQEKLIGAILRQKHYDKGTKA